MSDVKYRFTPPVNSNECEKISDMRMAAFLSHGLDDHTDLLEHKIGDVTYALRVVGGWSIDGIMGSPVYSTDASQDFVDAVDKMSVGERDRRNFNQTCYFEWIDENGDIASPPMDTIPIDAKKAIEDFQDRLKDDVSPSAAPAFS